MGQAELTSHIGLQLCEEDVRRRVGTCHKCADTTDQWGEEWIEASRDCHEADSDGRDHARIVHHRRHGDKADDGDYGEAKVDQRFSQDSHQLAERDTLDKATDRCTKEQHQAGIADPAELEGRANDR